MKSLNFIAANSQYLTRTFTAGNQKKWTFSTWIKRNSIGANNHIFFTGESYTEFGYLGVYITANNKLAVTTGTYDFKTTTQTFEDTSGWYHLLIAFDTAQAVAADRVKVFVDGVQITSFSSGIDPALNADYAINSATPHYLGRDFAGNYCNLLMADTYFIDGQALTPSSFISGSGHGTCSPISYTGTFGATGFWETHENATSTVTLGYDDAGGSAGSHAGTKDWTLNNMTTANSSSSSPAPPAPPPTPGLQNVVSPAFAISSAYANPPEGAFYGGTIVSWATADGPIAGVAWIGQKLEAAREIVHTTIEQMSAVRAINSVKVQYSDNGTTWTDVGTFAITQDAGVNVISFASVGAHYYWRYLANANPTERWHVTRITMSAPASTVPRPSPKFQAYGNLDQILTAGALLVVARFDARWYDTNAEYDDVLFRHKPKVAGFWHYDCYAMFKGTITGDVHVEITKNGAPFVLPWWSQPAAGLRGYGIDIPMNGTTDYVDVRIKVDAGTDIKMDGERSWFVGHFIGV